MVQTEKLVNTKTGTVQINNNGYIGKKKKTVLYRLKSQ